MKYTIVLLVLGILLLGCTQSSPPAKTGGNTGVNTGGNNNDGSDTYEKLLLKDEPQWVKDLVTHLKSEPVTNPPTFLQKCTVDSKVTYYQSPKAGDQMSVLYDQNGQVLCAPDGGIAGKGDEKCPDYFQTRTDCNYVWTDNRAFQ